MVAVKVCGLRRLEDVEYVNSCKPEYVGFIFAKSRREIDGEKARELSDALDDSIEKVGVFVNRELDELVEIAEQAELDVVQLHGEEDEEYISRIPTKYRVWKAIRVRDKSDIELGKRYDSLERVDGILLDAYHETEYGGSGQSFDWELVRNGDFKKLILAGGLDPENVSDAVEKSNPDVVDVSSGVETDGYKDFEKIKKFIEKARN